MNESATYNSIGKLIEPEPIAYSFNTPGWYMVFSLLLLTALVIVFFQYRKYRKNAYRREAVKQIESLVQQNTSVVYEINKHLKVMALGLFGRKKVASLFGLEWFTFLQSTMNVKVPDAKISFEEFSKALYDSSYKLNETKENELVEFAILWVKNHHVNV